MLLKFALPLIKNFDSYVADTIRNTTYSDPKLGKMIIALPLLLINSQLQINLKRVILISDEKIWLSKRPLLLKLKRLLTIDIVITRIFQKKGSIEQAVQIYITSLIDEPAFIKCR